MSAGEAPWQHVTEYTHLTVHRRRVKGPDVFRRCTAVMYETGVLRVTTEHEEVLFAAGEWRRVEGSLA